MNGHTNEMFTPDYALNPLLPFIKGKFKRVWECAYGKGHLAEVLRKEGFEVNGSFDFFNETLVNQDIIITNPPYSMKDEFLERAYKLNIPFAFLLPLTALEGIKRGKMYQDNGIQLIIPNRRINFITPNKGKSSWFATGWFCYGLDLPKDLMFVKLERSAVTLTPEDKPQGT